MTGVLRARVGGAWVDIVGGGAAGGGTDEVWIGPDDPAATLDPTAELWFDTDDDYTAGLTPTTVAGNALGIVSMGSMVTNVSCPSATETQITNTLTFALLTGRRYRVHVLARAVAQGGAATVPVNVSLRDGTTKIPNTNAAWLTTPAASGSYDNVNYAWIINGDGTTKNLNVTLNPSGAAVTAYTSDQSYFYIEDVGPNSSPALPIPDTPAAWTPVSSFLNGWTQQSGYPPVGYRKIGDLVYLRGSIAKPTGTAGQTAFVLPAGFRPPANIGVHEFVVEYYTTSNARAGGMIGIDSSGQVIPEPLGNIALNQIYFSVTP